MLEIILVLFSLFVRYKVTINKNVSLTDYAPGFQLPDCSKLAKNWKNDYIVIIFRHAIIAKFFWHCFVSLVRLSYWSKFHVNIITGSGVMTIFFYEGLARNPEIGNTSVWVLPNNRRLRRVRGAKFGTNVSNKMLLMLKNARVAAFTVSEFKEKRTWGTRGGGEITAYSRCWRVTFVT